jgi:RNA methyltransferase, TrmH family
MAKVEKKLWRIAGLPAVTALFATAPERVERLFFDDRLKAQAGAFSAVLAKARKPYRLVEAEELARVAGSAMHGGIVAIAQPVAVAEFDPAEAKRWVKDHQPLLILDGVSNPQNLGAIARTAAYFGLPRMVLSDHPSQAAPSDAAYRIAEGGLDYIKLYRITGLPAMLKRLRDFYLVLGTALGDGKPLDALHGGKRPIAIILGNEEHGLSSTTLKACEAVVTLPGAGRVQSLNVSASAAIFIHAALGHSEASGDAKLPNRQPAMTKHRG